MNITNIFISLKSNTFYKNISIVAGGNITARLITIALTPLITRIYSPSDFGIYNIFTSVIGILGTFATLRYAIAVPIASDEKEANNLLKLCFSITIGLSLLVSLLIYLFNDTIINLVNSESIRPFLWLIPIIFFGKGIYESLTNWAVRKRNFKLITRTTISQSIWSSLIKIVLGILNFKPLGLLTGHIAQEAAGIYKLISSLLKENKKFFTKFSIDEIKTSALRYKRFPLIQSWSQLLLSIGSQLPVLLLGIFYGIEVVGVFGLANSMIRLPIDLIGQAVSQVFYGEISKIGKNLPSVILKLTLSLLKKLFIISILPIIIIAIFGPWLFTIIFGVEWYDAGIYARILSIYILTAFVSAPIASIFNVFERMDLQFRLNFLRVILNALVFIICGYLKLSIVTTIISFSAVMSIYFVFMTFNIIKLIKSSIVDY